MSTSDQSGGCFCGQVRFKTLGEPNGVATCHCHSCQRIAGGDSVAWASFPIDSVTWEGHEPTAFNSSAGVERTFCPNCGSSLTYQNEAETIDLTLACFDDPEAHSPTKEIWLDHRRSWNPRESNIPGYREFRSEEQNPSEISD